jgi:uncharacterized membrane protein YccC
MSPALDSPSVGEVAGGSPISRLRRSWAPAGLLPQWSPAAALRATRATLVMAGLFAISDELIGNLQVATFAAFGSFATLVLSSFAGTRRDKLVAHALLALAGSALLTIGTAVTSSTALAALVTVPVTFAVFFAGVAGPNAASGATGALLAYVLPAASPGSVAMIPDRLAGWWLASVAGTAAVLLLSPRPEGDALRAAVSKMAGALAAEIEAALKGDAEDGLAACIAVKHELLASFTSTPYRPLGLAAPDQALANVVELLEWCTSLLIDAIREHSDLRRAPTADRELFAATAAVLGDAASLFADARVRLDLERLDRCRQASLASVAELTPGSASFQRDAQISFHAQAIAIAVLAIGADALVAERLVDPHSMADQRRAYVAASTARASRRLSGLAAAVTRHASVRSVWFINSLRVSVALGVAVAVADLSSVQHGFWVVLGTLSVLRTNAASTRSTALQALTGTAIGFVIGAALLLVIGAGATVLWVTLPVAVFIAAYAPGTAPFAVGQAAFTVTVAVLFNLIAPVGWKVGLLRIEDVAIGCAVSVVFGAMFWPRGVAAVVGDDIADSLRSGASFLAQAVQWTSGLTTVAPDGEPVSVTAALRLDDALRGFLTERGSKRIDKHELWRLVGGTLRLRLTAHAVAGLPRDPVAVGDARDALEHRANVLTAWYERLAELVDRPREQTLASIDPPTFGPEDVVLASSGSHYGVWLCEHLDHLAEHLGELVPPAVRIAELRRAPWWR